MRILVTGSASGLGHAMFNQLALDGHRMYEYDINYGHDVLLPNLDHVGELDVLINNAGLNHQDWLEDMSETNWDRVMDVNAKGIYMMSRACLPLLTRSKGTILNIVSNAAHIPMRCSLAYNASKGAAHIMTLQMARELYDRHGITVFGLAPNRLAGTPMSIEIDDNINRTRGWSREEARAYQLAALPTHRETPPALVADFVAYLLSSKQRHEYLHGCILPYGV